MVNNSSNYEFSFLKDFFNTIKSNFSKLLVNIDDTYINKDWSGFEKSGAFAVVSKASFKGRDIALKTIRLNFEEVREIVNGEGVELNALIEELKVMSILQHLNIPSLLGIIINESQYEVTFILELVDGKPLKELIDRHSTSTWSFIQKLWLSHKLASVLTYIRNAKVIHRDIKPENIMIGEDSNLEPYIIDFGLSKIKSADSEFTQTMQKCTPLYSPPENIYDLTDYCNLINASEESMLKNIEENTNLCSISYKVDVWSLGCVIYELFFEKQPFSYRTKEKNHKLQSKIFEYFQNGCTIFAPEDKNLMPDIIYIVENCTKISVKDRWTIEEANEAIFKLLQKQRTYVEEHIDNMIYYGEVILQNKGEKIFDGLGKLVYTDSESVKEYYYGGFQYGNKYGFGIELTENKNNNYYQGLWKNNKKHGEGFLKLEEYDELSFYLGKFSNGKKDGYGIYVAPDVVCYGNFHNDYIHEGYKYLKEEKRVFIGYFNQDMFWFGEVHELETGEVYYGEYDNDERNGPGYIRKKNGKIESSGIWKNNKLVIKVDLEAAFD